MKQNNTANKKQPQSRRELLTQHFNLNLRFSHKNLEVLLKVESEIQKLKLEMDKNAMKVD